MAAHRSIATVKSQKINNLWICGHTNTLPTVKPYVRIGIWDEDIEVALSIEEAMKLRKLLTEIIIESKQQQNGT